MGADRLTSGAPDLFEATLEIYNNNKWKEIQLVITTKQNNQKPLENYKPLPELHLLQGIQSDSRLKATF